MGVGWKFLQGGMSWPVLPGAERVWRDVPESRDPLENICNRSKMQGSKAAAGLLFATAWDNVSRPTLPSAAIPK
jgi:hypothetical protein